MHATANLVDEWPLVVNPQNIRLGVESPELLGDVAGNSFDTATSGLRARSYRGSDKRSRAVARQCCCHCRHRLLRAFHYVVAAGAMDMHVNESGNSSLATRGDFHGSSREAHVLTRPDRFNYAITN